MHRPIETYTTEWKTVTFSHESRVYPRSQEEVVEIVNHARTTGRKIKVVGGGHSFNNNVKTTDILMDLRFLNQIESIDRSQCTAVVGAGTTLFDCIEAFDKEGLHFPSLGSWSSQSIAGAISTSTHGSGLSTGSLSDIVLEANVVLSDGTTHHLSGEDVRLRGFRASLGQLGVVTKVKLKLTPSFYLRCSIHTVRDVDGFRDIVGIAENIQENPFVNMLFLPYTEQCCIRILRPCDGPRNQLAQDAEDAAVAATRLQNTKKDLWDWARGRAYLAFPDLLAEYWSGVLRHSFYADADQVDKSYNVFRYDKYGEPNTNHWLRLILNSEHALDTAQVESALTGVKKVLDEYRIRGRYINWPRVHLRFTQRSDQSLVGLNTDRDTAYIGIYMIATTDHEPQIEIAQAVEQVLLDHGGRPHWGKFHYSPNDGRHLATYSNWNRFLELRQELDPIGMFSDGLDDIYDLYLFNSTPWLQMGRSLFADDTYFPVRVV